MPRATSGVTPSSTSRGGPLLDRGVHHGVNELLAGSRLLPGLRQVVPDVVQTGGRRAAEHRTNRGAALGTAVAGSILIAALTTAFLQGVQGNPAIPESLQTKASVQLVSGVPFLSDAQLQT